MAKVVEVAEYILSKVDSMTAMKLEKLLYYSQAWHLAWTENPLFSEKIEAWRGGPVIPELFKLHKGSFKLQSGFFVAKLKNEKLGEQLTNDEKDVIDRVVEFYGKRDPHWLSQLTHMELPWKDARARSGVTDQDRSNEEITHQSMAEYYSSI